MRALALLTVLAVTVTTAATAAADEPAADKTIMQERIAQALFDRGMKLFEAELWSDAQALFEESLARSPRGARAAEAKDMIARCQAALHAPAAPDGEEPIDEPMPAGDAAPPADDAPLDPYADLPPRARQHVYRRYRPEWLPPTAFPSTAQRPSPERKVRNMVVVFGGGTAAALGYLGYSVFSDNEGGVLPVVVGAAAVGLTTSWYVVRGRKIAEGDASVAMSATTWGAVLATAVVNLFDDPTRCASCLAGQEDVGRGVYYGAGAAGAAGGLAGGILFARRYHPSPGDVALTNSVTAYGAGTGVFVGVMMQPSQGRAYTFNATLGAALGLGAGIYLARRTDVSRTRVAIMDGAAILGALAGYYVVGGLIDRDDASHTDERIRAAAGTIGMLGGAFLAWTYSRGKLPRRIDKVVERHPAPPALVTRGADGAWRLGGLAPTAYGTVDGRSALGVSILSGRF